MNEKTLGYSTENARSAEQAAGMKEAAEKGVCIFCSINFEKNKPLNRLGEFNPEGKDWPLIWVWENPYPQEHQGRHLMFIPKRHLDNESWNEITNEEWLQILDAWKWAQEFYNIPGGGFVGRFGQRTHNAGTIGHLHFQLQIPDLSGNVKATFCKDRSPEKEIARMNREAYFGDIVEGYVYANEHGLFLAENLRWKKCNGAASAFVHTEKANDLIWKMLRIWEEDKKIISIWKARWEKNKDTKTLSPVMSPEIFFSEPFA
jgi:hypothetical protein